MLRQPEAGPGRAARDRPEEGGTIERRGWIKEKGTAFQKNETG